MSDEVEWRKGYWDSNTTLYCDLPYVNGQLHGVGKWYCEDGTTLCQKIPYVNGQQHGVGEGYHEDGTLEWERYWVYGVEKYDLTPLEKLVLFGEEA